MVIIDFGSYNELWNVQAHVFHYSRVFYVASQLANTGRPLKILFEHPEDVPNLRPDLMFWGRLEMTSRNVIIWRPMDVPGRVIRNVPRTFWWCPPDGLENMYQGWCRVICWMSLNFFLLFFWNLFNWLNLSKSNSILKLYLEPSQTTKIRDVKPFCELDIKNFTLFSYESP